MFTADEIHTRVRRHPFVPVRIVTIAGEAFDVCHPRMIMIGRRALMVGQATVEVPTIYEQVTRIELADVMALEDLPTPPLKPDKG